MTALCSRSWQRKYQWRKMAETGHTVSDQNFQRVVETQGKLMERFSKLPRESLAEDLLNVNKPREQLEILCRYLPDKNLNNKKLLEIGSGLGIFQLVARKEYHMDPWGVEPSGEGFMDSLDICCSILNDNGVSCDQIMNAQGEQLPFKDNSFDIVFSTNALEHVHNEAAVIHEAIRVCKPGGIIQIVVPNFGSFFDGHYACFYVPYQPKWLWKSYVKYILRRDPSFVNSLGTNINYFSVRRILNRYRAQVEVLTYGSEIFMERMESLSFTPWAGLIKVKGWLSITKKLHLNSLLARCLIFIKAFTPLILTLKKL